ncbi:putative S-layer protein, partial [Candidatus Pacearchaeota archaeon]|nr:putative S-layer protein [Candidatus Pacearchaeota archaeon]
LTFSSTTQTVQAILSNLQNIKFGLNTVNVQATAGTQSATSSFQVKKTFCTAGETSNGNITIRNIDWSNEGEGEDNNWELLDEIELEVEVGNSNDDEDVDVIVELGLYDSSGKNIADDLRFSSDSDSDNEEIEININDDDEETVNYKFMVPADFDSGSYKLAVKVYNDDSGESKDCDDSSSDLNNGFFQIIDIEEASDEGRFVVVDDFNLDSQFTCGQAITGQFTIFNIGNKDQDRVKILIQNDDLKINEFVEYTSDLDKGEEETLDFTINIPVTAKNGIKELKFTTLYDYRNGVYREESEDTFSAFIEVIGCSKNLANPVSQLLTNINIEAELSSDAISGKELIVTSTITNTGTEEKSFNINAQGYSEWAEISSTSNDLISLKAGESKQVTFKFNINEKTIGAQTFDIQVTSEGKVQVQQVELNVEANEGFSFDLKRNSTLWIIGLVNAILIILIIVVAIRISKK